MGKTLNEKDLASARLLPALVSSKPKHFICQELVNFVQAELHTFKPDF